MRQRNLTLLAGIVLLVLLAVWIDMPTNRGLHLHLGPIKVERDIKVRQGLDLQGGLQVLLEADVSEDEPVDDADMEAARTIVENRVDSLGVVEPLVQRQGGRRIIVELPGIEDPELAIATIRQTGLLEFIDAGSTFLPPGTIVKTTYPRLASEGATTLEPTTTPTEAMTGIPSVKTPLPSPTAAELTPTPTPTAERIFPTVLTGRHLDRGGLGIGRKEVTGELYIAFKLTDEGAPILADFTARNVGRHLAIALDKEIISCPVIESAIPEGAGIIKGEFSPEEARRFLVQLRYGALPIPLRVETTRAVGPTLGQESIQKSVTAGTIGLAIVLLFMLAYYRLPGFLADLALIIYGLLNFAIYKFGIPGLFDGVTLTLPGITGFLLSTGMAVDANILIFERMREELRAGRSLAAAIETGFQRAWTSIWDSNLSTIIVCGILYFFGSRFGASIVKGFAITLFFGVCISMFTAITVTRTFIRFVFDLAGERLRAKKWLLGI